MQTPDPHAIMQALGGRDNIVSIVGCITRVRVEVADPSAVSDSGLRCDGVVGVVRSGKVVQVVIGPSADELAEQLNDLEKDK